MLARNKTLWQIFLLTGALFWLGWRANAGSTFFSNDIGLRFYQARQLVINQWQTMAVAYPARFLDPDLEYVPFYYAYSILNGEFYFNISAFLPWLASFFLYLFGPWSLPLLPIMGGVLTAVATYQLGRLANVARPRFLLWLTIFATPIFFYSLELWDHSLGTACAMWAVFGAARGLVSGRWSDMAWAGLAAGLGLGQRPELYLFVLALGIAWIVVSWPRWRWWLALVMGALLGALPVWLLQLRWVGHPLGMAVAPTLFGYGRPPAYPVQSYSEVVITPALRIGRLLLYVDSRDVLTFSAAMCVIVGSFGLALLLRIPRWRRPRWLALTGCLILVGFLLYAVQSWQAPLPGLVTTFPLLAFALAYVNKRDDVLSQRSVYQFAYLSCFLFVGGMLLLWPAFGGNQWGARYLLPAYPLLLFLALYTASNWWRQLDPAVGRILRIVFTLLLMSSILLQALGLRLLLRSHTGQEMMQQAISDLPAELILTNHPFIPSYMTPLEEKMFIYVSQAEDIELLISRMGQNGIDRFALITVEGTPLSVPVQVGEILIHETAPLVYELERVEP